MMPHFENTRYVLAALLGYSALAACGSSDEDAAGMESSSCLDGACFGDLQCLSDFCVAPEATETNESTPGSDGESQSTTSTTGANTTASSTATTLPTTTGQSTDASGPTSTTTTDPTEGFTESGSTTGATTESESSSGPPPVDVLFVVDNSASTAVFQSNLVDALPQFVAGIEAVGDDVHIGVTTTDAYAGNSSSCNELGGLVIRTAGADSSNASCGPYAEGENYMTEADALDQTLGCAARVGTEGSPLEAPMQAMLAATDGSLRCNAGFLRDDSLLVVIIVTDEYDGPNDPEMFGSPGSANSWFADLVAQRGSPETTNVIGVLTNYDGGPCPPTDEFFDGGEIVAFAELFTYGVVGGICEDFSPFAEELSDAINAAYDSFGG